MRKPKTKLIGFCGKMQNGKTTSAQLTKSLFPEYRICSFASRLKEIAYELGWDGVKDNKGRKVLQYLGTEVCRNIDGKYWIYQLHNTIKNNEFEYVVIDDIRFQNEADFIKKNNGILIHIERRGLIKILFDKILGVFGCVHKSEIIPDGIDFKIKNNNTISYLEKKIENIIFE